MMKKTTPKLIGAAALTPLFAPSAALAASAQCTGAQIVGATCDGGQVGGQLNAIINSIFFIAGTLAVIVIIIAGIMYINSTGDSKRIQQAKDTLFYAISGLIVVLVARLIVGFIISRFG